MANLGPENEEERLQQEAEFAAVEKLAKEIIENAKAKGEAVFGGFKISRKSAEGKANKLTHSYLCLIAENGDIELFRQGEVEKEVEHTGKIKIIARGTQGKVKTLMDRQGNIFDFIVKTSPAEIVKDSGLEIMKKLNLIKGHFIKKRIDPLTSKVVGKLSKTMNQMIGNKHYVIMKRFPGEDLDKVIAKLKKSDTEDKQIQLAELALNAAKSLAKLHEQNIVHRDVKAGNFIADLKTGEVNITDIDDARELAQVETDGTMQWEVTERVTGSPYHMAPELGGDELAKLTKKIDEKKKLIANLKQDNETEREKLKKDNEELAECEKKIEENIKAIQEIEKELKANLKGMTKDQETHAKRATNLFLDPEKLKPSEIFNDVEKLRLYLLSKNIMDKVKSKEDVKQELKKHLIDPTKKYNIKNVRRNASEIIDGLANNQIVPSKKMLKGLFKDPDLVNKILANDNFSFEGKKKFLEKNLINENLINDKKAFIVDEYKLATEIVDDTVDAMYKSLDNLDRSRQPLTEVVRLERENKKYQEEMAELKRNMETYNGKIKTKDSEIEAARAIGNPLIDRQNELLGKTMQMTSAIDIYSLGVMYSRAFGIDLDAIGLSNMRNKDPKQRPNIQEVTTKLELYLRAKKNVKDFVRDHNIRLPEMVKADELYLHQNNSVSLLAENQLQQLNEVRKDEKSKNSVRFVGKKEVYFSAEGGAFVIHSTLMDSKFGKVMLAQDVDSGSWVVVKALLGQQEKIRLKFDEYETEKENLKNAGEYLGAIHLTDNPTAVVVANVIPYAFGEDYQKIYDKGEIPPQECALLILKAMEALADLHEMKGCLHRDVKLDNVKWDGKQAKLIDFGNAFKGTEQRNSKQLGAIESMAPELQPSEDPSKMIVEGRVYNQKTDLYSMGVLIEKLLSKTDPTSQVYREFEIIQKALKAVPQEVRLTTQEALKRIIVAAKKSRVQISKIQSAEALLGKINAKTPLESIVEDLPGEQKPSREAKRPAEQQRTSPLTFAKKVQHPVHLTPQPEQPLKDGPKIHSHDRKKK